MQALGPRYAIPVHDEEPSGGAREAAVTMVVFIDYGDATTVGVASDLQQLIDLHGDRLRIVIKPHTRSYESNARYVARAVLAAGRQGRGWLMHQRLSGHTEGIRRRDAIEIAAAIGILDLRAFGRDIDNQDPLDRNVELARRFGVNAQTFIFINGAAYPQLDGFAALRSAYEAEAAVAYGLLDAGVVPGKLYATMIEAAERQRPAILVYEPPFDGEPISEESLAGGVGIEVFGRGDGELVVDDDIVSFEFRGYAMSDGRQVMASREEPAKIVITQPPPDPIAEAMVDSLRGHHVGALLRVTVPPSAYPPDAAKRLRDTGGIVMTIEILDRVPRPPLAGLAAFSGKPQQTERRPGGIEISDYAPGRGRRAEPGDRVTVHYIGQLDDGTEFDRSHNRVEGIVATVGAGGIIEGFAQALEGVRIGMLRKVVIPPELGYRDREQGKIPPNSTLTFYLEVTDVSDGEETSDAQTDDE